MLTLARSMWIFAMLLTTTGLSAANLAERLDQLQIDRGVVAILGIPPEGTQALVAAIQQSSALVYIQTDDSQELIDLRSALRAAGLLGVRAFVDNGPPHRIQLADNVADGLLATNSKGDPQEILRVLRPHGVALWGDQRLVKPVPEGIDEWTHPYHGPDNNPQSRDQLVKGDFRTQFLATPKFSPMPEQTVVAGGRIFKAMGHIAHKANQNEWLNTLLCINAYNGTILWRRPLPAGFMIHRNTMIATEHSLLMGDAQSCKVFDARNGEIQDEFTIPEALTDGPVWKWMAMRDGVLYGLVGNPEIQVDTQKSARRGLGHWPWGMWEGHDYNDPRTSFGFGRTLVAIDVDTKKLLWHYRDDEFLDARGVCMSGSKIFCFSPEHFLMCLDADTGDLLWKNTDADLLTTIGPNARAQHYVTGYATTCYMKCNEDYVFFAGPQRERMVTASARDGSLQWSYPHGNLQLVLRDDAIYAAGPKTTGVRLEYGSGQQLSTLPTRRACTRATGCADSIFYRTSGGTVRVMTESNTSEHISPMRPPCQDGVIVSNGHLYWGPWMCGCQLSLYGHIALAPIGDSLNTAGEALWTNSQASPVSALPHSEADWTAYRGGHARRDTTDTTISARLKRDWNVPVSNDALVTAPVVAGGMVFLADRTGAVHAFDTQGNSLWTSHTGGAIYYAPAVAQDRIYVGSADGRVYCFVALSGELQWSYRVGPNEQRIPVYDQLINRWPIAGGVVVHEGRVYAAGGIAHYDGTYVVALNALSGKLIARNDTSGMLSPEVNSGISLQGNLMIKDNELQFLAGGVYETARYDLATLKCLNQPKVQLTSQFRTAFYPFYPEYGKYVSIDHPFEDGGHLVQDASYEGSKFTDLERQGPLPPGVPREKQEAARWARRQGTAKPKIIWQDKTQRRFTAVVISGNTMVGGGHREGLENQPALWAVDVQTGKDLWQQELSHLPVKGGLAVGPDGSIYGTLENGELVRFAAAP